MFGNNENSRGATDRDLESLVTDAMGDSVTPSRLLRSNLVGFIRRLLGLTNVEGPFTAHLRANEQPHYLFHSTSDLSFPEEEDEFEDDHLSLRGTSIISPVIGMVTDQRTSFIYGSGDDRRVVSMEHTDIVDVDYRNRKIEEEFILQSTRRRLAFGMWTTDPYSAEMSDAAAYIYDKSGSEGGYQSYDFGSDDFGAASNTLREQLREVQSIADEVDLDYVIRCGVKGAKIGVRRSAYTAGVGFLLGAGYGIWSDHSGRREAGFMGEDIDPEKTAEVMLRWQKAGKLSKKKSMELAAGALGAAIAIDQQTSGRQLTSALAEVDVEWVSNQLLDGNQREASLQVASDVVTSYSTELGALIDDDFFKQIAEKS